MSKDNRESMTIEYAIEKRKSLLAELNSDEHYDQTPTVAFGNHDPFSVPKVVCETCGGRPITRGEGTRWVAECGCGRRIKVPQKKRWQAELEWNWINLKSFNYRDFPLFGLSGLNPTEARERLAAIRKNIELRKALAGIETTVAIKTERAVCEKPGKGYVEKIDCYLKWCMWALRLVKVAASHETEKVSRRCSSKTGINAKSTGVE
ncbi:hypothetical protein LCGC14_0743660 [marine sediment metagenome]|uniref:Uncharacterized protein n=1 Tax=marine sediment metagenome TaxID=412755 RepID=A0A0F9QR28_9ZZZZ